MNSSIGNEWWFNLNRYEECTHRFGSVLIVGITCCTGIWNGSEIFWERAKTHYTTDLYTVLWANNLEWKSKVINNHLINNNLCPGGLDVISVSLDRLIVLSIWLHFVSKIFALIIDSKLQIIWYFVSDWFEQKMQSANVRWWQRSINANKPMHQCKF